MINLLAGLVPCKDDCTLADLFGMVGDLMSEAVKYSTLIIAPLFIIIAGVMWITAHGKESQITNAKKLIWGVVIGLLFIWGAYLIVQTILKVLGSSYKL